MKMMLCDLNDYFVNINEPTNFNLSNFKNGNKEVKYMKLKKIHGIYFAITKKYLFVGN